jgi:D-sedoheptulose 7-phosphate isomerase
LEEVRGIAARFVGGSVGNTSHAVNDFRNLCDASTDNVSELTARINDDGWDTAFANWPRGSRSASTDAVLVLSVEAGDAARNVSVNLVRTLDPTRAVGARIGAVVGA